MKRKVQVSNICFPGPTAHRDIVSLSFVHPWWIDRSRPLTEEGKVQAKLWRSHIDDETSGLVLDFAKANANANSKANSNANSKANSNANAYATAKGRAKGNAKADASAAGKTKVKVNANTNAKAKANANAKTNVESKPKAKAPQQVQSVWSQAAKNVQRSREL